MNDDRIYWKLTEIADILEEYNEMDLTESTKSIIDYFKALLYERGINID